MATFNEEKLVAGETSVDRVLSAVKVVPMMAKHRLVGVRTAQKGRPAFVLRRN